MSLGELSELVQPNSNVIREPLELGPAKITKCFLPNICFFGNYSKKFLNPKKCFFSKNDRDVLKRREISVRINQLAGTLCVAKTTLALAISPYTVLNLIPIKEVVCSNCIFHQLKNVPQKQYSSFLGANPTMGTVIKNQSPKIFLEGGGGGLGYCQVANY